MSEPVEDFLDSDPPIIGQNYVCLSFVSPEKFLKQKEMYLFHKYMVDKFREYSEVIDVLSKKHLSIDDLENATEAEINNDVNKKLVKELRERSRLQFQYSYDQFKTNYEDFMYKYGDKWTETFDKENEFKTSMRALKVRGVYESHKEAEVRARALQRRDQNFHVFVGTVGAWLPWDPEADRVQNEEYLNDELNNLIKEYKKNQVHKDMLYEQEKEDRKKDQMRKKIAEEELEKQERENQKNMANIEDNLESEDPWMQRKAVEDKPETSEN
jgi:hypothetical protein